jgi:hypothetical protein
MRIASSKPKRYLSCSFVRCLALLDNGGDHRSHPLNIYETLDRSPVIKNASNDCRQQAAANEHSYPSNRHLFIHGFHHNFS